MKDWQKKKSGLEQRFLDRLARLAEEEDRDARTHRLCILGGALESMLEAEGAERTERMRRALNDHVAEHHRDVVWGDLVGPNFDI
ncbi:MULTISPECIES: hypothetical protein [unclassified Sulfitobacter]|uniref:hypothetical protein n=1 Tax=unclassified Sulfitobacter TaxID=196795 RepID=UPI0004E381CD|nr:MULTISPECIES: hypothetical protein [unclassified Sulfitobacter]PTA98887.1 hypothetical protein C8254_10475 [Sulfitobacter sp. CB-A]ULO18995.1 hypothetical protein IV89_001986 [Sulfitobacter sp. CB2047]